MKKWLLIALSLLLIGSTLSPRFALSTDVLFILNHNNKAELPRQFRIADLHTTDKIAPLHASASGQFSEESLKEILKIIPKNHFILVDLREEPHGFIDGHAVSWYADKNWVNQGKSLIEIEKDENKRLKKLAKKNLVTVYVHKTYPYPYPIQHTFSEKELADNLGISYIRFPIRDHVKPRDDQVDSILSFFQSLTDDNWVHFHCSAGRGRSTTLLAMLDIWRNHSQSTFEEIVQRQIINGGVNLLNIPDVKVWKIPYAIERADFLRNFYLYCNENTNHQISWMEWISRQ